MCHPTSGFRSSRAPASSFAPRERVLRGGTTVRVTRCQRPERLRNGIGVAIACGDRAKRQRQVLVVHSDKDRRLTIGPLLTGAEVRGYRDRERNASGGLAIPYRKILRHGKRGYVELVGCLGTVPSVVPAPSRGVAARAGSERDRRKS